MRSKTTRKQEQKENLEELTKKIASLEKNLDDTRSRLRKIRESVAPLRDVIAEKGDKNNDNSLENLHASIVSVRSLSPSLFSFVFQ